MNKEIKYRVKSIIEVLVFLLAATAYWFGPRESITTNIMSSINDYQMNKKITVKTDRTIEFDKKVNFTVTNKTDIVQNYEIIVVNDYKKTRKNNCTVLDNNYLKYKLNDYEEQNLSIEGIIYTGEIQPKEQKDFNINISKDNSKGCYYPVIKVSTFYKI